MTFTFEQQAIHHLILRSPYIQDVGLFHGKTGIALFFFRYSGFTGNTVYSDFAHGLLYDIWYNSHNSLPDTFESGLTGIAWGIEYLIQNKFVSGNSNNICRKIDNRIMHFDIRRMTSELIENDLEGFLHYVLIRTLGNIQQQNELPFDEMYRNDLFCTFSNLLKKKMISETSRTLIHNYLTFVSDGKSLDYVPNLSLFVEDCKIDKDRILSSPLGLNKGLAGMLYKQIKLPAL